MALLLWHQCVVGHVKSKLWKDLCKPKSFLTYRDMTIWCAFVKEREGILFFAIPSGRFGTKVENLSFSRLKVISVAKLVGLCKTNQQWRFPWTMLYTKPSYMCDIIKISSLLFPNGFVGLLPILGNKINNEGDFIVFWFLWGFLLGSVKYIFQQPR